MRTGVQKPIRMARNWRDPRRSVMTEERRARARKRMLEIGADNAAARSTPPANAGLRLSQLFG